MFPENLTHRPDTGHKPAKYDGNCSHQSGEQFFLDRSFRHIEKTNNRTEIDKDERQQAERLLLCGATHILRSPDVKFKVRTHVWPQRQRRTHLRRRAAAKIPARISSQFQSRAESPAVADSTRQLPRKISQILPA